VGGGLFILCLAVLAYSKPTAEMNRKGKTTEEDWGTRIGTLSPLGRNVALVGLLNLEVLLVG